MNYLPIHCFPSASWLATAMQDDVVLDLHEHYEKQTFRNRFDILGVNGKMSLTIPVEGQKGVKTLSKDIRIANHNWRKLHLKSIHSAYGRAAYFQFYIDELTPIFMTKQSFLMDFNMEILEWLRSKKLIITRNLSDEFMAYENKTRAQFHTPAIVPSYLQVFSDRFQFVPSLSSLDMLMNLGPRTVDHILLWKNGK